VSPPGEVPLSGIFIYLGLFKENEDNPTNDPLNGERFENTEDEHRGIRSAHRAVGSVPAAGSDA
jgi:hypothetical protein